MPITLPNLCLVVLIGPSGSGKSTFARKHFRPTEVISSDYCRGLVSDDDNDQAATPDAFEVLHFIAAKRLRAGKLTVIDATNTQPESRQPLVALARSHDVLPVAIVLSTPEAICRERNVARPDRQFGPHVVLNQIRQLRRSLRGLDREGFRKVFVLNSPAEIDAAAIVRERVWNDLRHEHGPFDIIGDIHGCGDELEELLAKLGYAKAPVPAEAGDWPDVLPREHYAHAAGRRAIFVGDLVDRGPQVVRVLDTVRAMVFAGTALCVPGNHDIKLLRHLHGHHVKLTHGLEQTLADIAAIPDDRRAAWQADVTKFLDSLVSHYVLDDGKLVVAHAGMKAEYQGRTSGRVREFALYGETTGETDEFGLPVRLNWAAEYRGQAIVVYGHTPVPEPEWLNHTINIDTGCVFGGRLTALRYPERELVAVAARRTYCEPARPFLPPPGLSLQQQLDDLLDIDDCLGKRLIDTRLAGKVTIRAEQSAAALEVMSRFAANPKWLIYLPPTMSPCDTALEGQWLEHPEQVFAYYREAGVPEVICQEKHMGSRAVVVIAKGEEAARKRFGVEDEGRGIVVTRTGRRFFDDVAMEHALLDRLHQSLDAARWWDRFTSDWFCFDCELMPWSAKAQELLRRQYAAVGSAAGAGLRDAVAALDASGAREGEAPAEPGSPRPMVGALADRYRQRQDCAARYRDAYARYCWPVNSVADLRLAPFHLLAAEGHVFTDHDHLWHMQTLAELAGPACRAGPGAAGDVVQATHHFLVDLADPASCAAGVRWWEELTAGGGEGMVVKPREWIVRGERGLVQPAMKCRGREYLRIIYGPEYTLPDHLHRLRRRSTGAKRALASREFALGLEALERFVRREPLRRVHECVFGVLALESEPVDPRL
ncbi:MAG: polynucleotide kinase-phosphatase [Planctomycetaceae bacterium]|nr:polynucleotide kinase-phosphatase [Planctomycetaceae bacterium]